MADSTEKNGEALFNAACAVISGGVNSPVRAFKAVGGTPLFISHAKGPYIFDSHGKSFIDYVCSWGPMILGHADPDVVAAVHRAAEKGLSFGAPTTLETELAENICSEFPSIDRIRMVSSGTEATMSAIRLARGFTGRDVIVKFEGCYHGHVDSLLIKSGSGSLTLGKPSSSGVPLDLAKHTINIEFNNIEQVSNVFRKFGDAIAAVIVEPITGNMNCITPVSGFLEILRSECDHHGSVLIFDEVMTGFRVALGGAQSIYGIRPDITALGKVIGGGLPVGAFGGRAEIMDYLAPQGSVYQAGTLSGNPVAMAAGLATVKKLKEPGFFDAITEKTRSLTIGLQEAATEIGVPFATEFSGGMFGLFFTNDSRVKTFKQVMSCDNDKFIRFFHGMLDRGVYLAPSSFEAGFLSITHNDIEIQKTINAAREIFEEINLEN